jgi:hypothetical protein
MMCCAAPGFLLHPCYRLYFLAIFAGPAPEPADAEQKQVVTKQSTIVQGRAKKIAED